VVTSKSGNWRGPQVALNYLERCDGKVFAGRKGLPRLLSHEADHTNFCGNIMHRRKLRDRQERVGSPECPSRLCQRSPSTVVERAVEVLELVL
jgi:hypothetical protein